MSRVPIWLLGVGSCAACMLLVTCGKRRIEPARDKTEFRDEGTACLRVGGGVFMSNGRRELEVTVIAPDRRRCNDLDFAGCAVENGEHGESRITARSRCSRHTDDARPMADRLQQAVTPS